MIKKILLGSLFFFSTAVLSIDLGVKGRIYEVIEIDLRVVIMQMVEERIDLEAHEKERNESAKDYYSKLPIWPLPLSAKHESYFVDPTRVYEEDFWALERLPSGKLKWVKSVEAGKEVNWLEHSESPMPVFFIFDFNSSTQKELAKGLIDSGIPHLKIVFTGGDLVAANEFMGTPLTYLNKSMIDEYDIKYTPSLVRRGAGNYRNRYHVTRFNINEITTDIILKEYHEKD